MTAVQRPAIHRQLKIHNTLPNRTRLLGHGHLPRNAATRPRKSCTETSSSNNRTRCHSSLPYGCRHPPDNKRSLDLALVKTIPHFHGTDHRTIRTIGDHSQFLKIQRLLSTTLPSSITSSPLVQLRLLLHRPLRCMRKTVALPQSLANHFNTDLAAA